MLTTRFKLPPLEGDDVAMLMERDMLRRWGFLGPPQQQQQQRNNTTKKNTGSKDDRKNGSPESNDSTNDGSESSSCSCSDDDEDVDRDEGAAVCGDESDNARSSQGITGTKPQNEVQSLENTDPVPENEDKKQECRVNEDSVVVVVNKRQGSVGEDITPENLEVIDKREEIGDKDKGDIIKNQETEDKNQKCQNGVAAISKGCVGDTNASPSAETSLTQERTYDGVDESEKSADSVEEKDERPEPAAVDERSKEQELKSERKKEMSGEVLVLYQEASRHYDQDDFCECMLSVEEALELCGSGGGDGSGSGSGVQEDGNCGNENEVDVTPLWLLRAKVMNSMENYKEALRSAYKVKAKERPSRMWIEGAIAMEKLGIQVTAELWIAMGLHKWKEESLMTSATQDGEEGELWDTAVDSDVMCVLKMMQNRLRVERIYGPLVKDMPIKVMASLRYNRTVHATKKIKKGEIIFHELPDILEQSIRTHHITACAECAKSLIQPEDVIGKSAAAIAKPNQKADIKKGLRKIWPKLRLVSCSFCSAVKYCSEECRRKSWDTHHKVVCPSNSESTAAMLYDVRRSFRDVMAADGSTWQGWWNTEFSPTLLSRMMAMVLCKANLLADLRTRESYSDAHWSMCESILEKYSACDKMHAADQVPKMQELLNNIFKRSKFLRYEITKEIFNRRYSQAITNVIRFHDTTHPMNNFSQKLKSENDKLFKKMKKCNEKSLETPTIAEFYGLFPLASCLNHSCFPNAVVESASVRGQPGISVRAARDIREGDEVIIAYVDPQWERHERRKILWRQYKFVCECPRCLHQGIGPHICTNCGKSAQFNSVRNNEDEPSSQADVSGVDEREEAGNGTDQSQDTATEDVKGSQDTQGPVSDELQQPEIKNVSKTIDADINNCNTDEVSDVLTQNAAETQSQVASCHCDSEKDDVDNVKNQNREGRDGDVVQNVDGVGSVEPSTCDATLKNGQEIENKVEQETQQISETDCEGQILTAGIQSEPKIVDKFESDSEISNDDGDCNAKAQEKPKNGSNSETKSGNAPLSVFAACGRCKKAWYCSVTCQKDSWTNGHKRICKAP